MFVNAANSGTTNQSTVNDGSASSSWSSSNSQFINSAFRQARTFQQKNQVPQPKAIVTEKPHEGIDPQTLTEFKEQLQGKRTASDASKQDQQRESSIYLQILDQIRNDLTSQEEYQILKDELAQPASNNMINMIFKFYLQSQEYDFFLRRLKNVAQTKISLGTSKTQIQPSSSSMSSQEQTVFRNQSVSKQEDCSRQTRILSNNNSPLPPYDNSNIRSGNTPDKYSPKRQTQPSSSNTIINQQKPVYDASRTALMKKLKHSSPIVAAERCVNGESPEIYRPKNQITMDCLEYSLSILCDKQPSPIREQNYQHRHSLNRPMTSKLNNFVANEQCSTPKRQSLSRQSVIDKSRNKPVKSILKKSKSLVNSSVRRLKWSNTVQYSESSAQSREQSLSNSSTNCSSFDQTQQVRQDVKVSSFSFNGQAKQPTNQNKTFNYSYQPTGAYDRKQNSYIVDQKVRDYSKIQKLPAQRKVYEFDNQLDERDNNRYIVQTPIRERQSSSFTLTPQKVNVNKTSLFSKSLNNVSIRGSSQSAHKDMGTGSHLDFYRAVHQRLS